MFRKQYGCDFMGAYMAYPELERMGYKPERRKTEKKMKEKKERN